MPPRIEPIVCPYDGSRVMAYYVDASCPTLIDTGGASHPGTAIAGALRERATDLAAVQVVINTHGHWDHAGGDAAVSSASGAAVLIHESGAPFLLDHRRHLDGYYTEASRALEQPALLAAQRATFPTVFGPELIPNRLLHDGDQLDLGNGVVFDVIHVPGHADEHIALYWEREGVLIAGDSAQGTGTRPGGCPLYFGSIREARASLRRLRDLPFRMLHISHPCGRLERDERTVSYEAEAGRAYLSESLTALEIMEAALREGLRADPDADFPALARAASEALVRAGRWPVSLDPLTGVPHNAAPTFYRLWRELDAG